MNPKKVDCPDEIQEQENDLLVDQRFGMKYNINKVYTFFWSQCTDTIYSVIKVEEKYMYKADTYDTLCAMEALKNIA